MDFDNLLLTPVFIILLYFILKRIISKYEDTILKKTSNNFGYLTSELNFISIRMDDIFSLFTFGRYAPIRLFFRTISFSSFCKFFHFFHELYAKIYKQFAAVSVCLVYFIVMRVILIFFPKKYFFNVFKYKRLT